MGISKNIRDRLIAIERTLVYNSETVKAAEYVPEMIQPGQTPLFVNYPAGPSRTTRSDRGYDVTRTWNLELYCRAAGGDGGRAENENRALDLTDLTYDLFAGRTRLELAGEAGITGLRTATLTSDVLEIRPYPAGEGDDAVFYVVTFTLDVEYRSIC